MDQQSCTNERWSNIGIGMVLLIIAICLTLISFFIAPVFGLIFAIPVFIVAVIFLMAPHSKSCALILEKFSGK